MSQTLLSCPVQLKFYLATDMFVQLLIYVERTQLMAFSIHVHSVCMHLHPIYQMEELLWSGRDNIIIRQKQKQSLSTDVSCYSCGTVSKSRLDCTVCPLPGVRGTREADV